MAKWDPPCYSQSLVVSACKSSRPAVLIHFLTIALFLALFLFDKERDVAIYIENHMSRCSA